MSSVRCADGRRTALTLPVGMLLCTLMTWGSDAYALNPALDVSQYAHAIWRTRDGFAKGSSISSIAQTPDGYLWLGTEFGLLRFDGVRTVEWHPAAGESLPGRVVRTLLAARDGTLWIGTSEGLASWKDGALTSVPQLESVTINALLEDHEGTVWVAGETVTVGRLCSIRGSVHCAGEDGSLGRFVLSVFEDRRLRLWVAAENGLWQWKPGPSPKMVSLPHPISLGLQVLTEDRNGSTLIGTKRGIAVLADSKTGAVPLPGVRLPEMPIRLLQDRNGALWIGTANGGIFHFHEGRTDTFTRLDGLSGNFVSCLFEDREGSIWVGTREGLDRFREYAATTFSARQGLSGSDAGSVLAARDGSVWISTRAGVDRWKSGALQKSVGGKLPTHGYGSLFQDSRGRIWFGATGGIGYFESNRFVQIDGVHTSNVVSMSGDGAGNVWIADQDLGLVKVSGDHDVQRVSWSSLRRNDIGFRLANDSSKGGLWIGYFRGGIDYYSAGRVQASYAVEDGLGAGRVNHLRLAQDGVLWAGTEGGLSRIKNGHVATLTGNNGLPCDNVDSMVEDDNSLWLYMTCGIARISLSDLDAWATAIDKGRDSTRTILATVFDSSDGVRNFGSLSTYTPHVATTPDRKLWFVTLDGVSVIDPRHLPFNSLPPPLQIEQVTADRKPYDVGALKAGPTSLPALTRELQIDYTALSFVAPEKIRFRYKLEGHDGDWQDVGARRQAFYNDLPPRTYRFRVIASNNSGVWNEAGAFLDFSIAPAYYQTTWFRVGSIVAVLVVIVGSYRWRLRQIAHAFNARLDERVNERTRIARELHDTLLQSFQGLMLRFQTARNLMPAHPGKAIEALDGALDRADQAIAEGRDAIQNLRSSTIVSNELAQAITGLAEELNNANGGSEKHSATFRMSVEGSPRDLHPIVRDDIHRIAREALRNAFRHAQADRIEAEVTYGARELRLRIRDNGNGIDPQYLSGGRVRHWGLAGMRERAVQIGGQLNLWSEMGAGTEVELRVPGAVAYTAPGGRGGVFRMRRKEGNGS